MSELPPSKELDDPIDRALASMDAASAQIKSLRMQIGKLTGQAEAWEAVWEALKKDPYFINRHGGYNGLTSAVREIGRLQRDVKLLEIVGQEQQQRISELKGPSNKPAQPPKERIPQLTAEQEARALDIQEDCRQMPRWAARTIVRYEDRSAELWSAFKNFHRLLCERFGYVHDEKDWDRDKLSLIEHIAQRASNEPSAGAQVLARIVWSEFCQPGSLDDREAAVAKLIQGFIDARAAQPPAVNEDAARLDYLDSLNQRLNAQQGSSYGWRLDINHNRVSLTDMHVPALTVREAIDALRPTPTKEV
jgi:hypothetical protein